MNRRVTPGRSEAMDSHSLHQHTQQKQLTEEKRPGRVIVGYKASRGRESSHNLLLSIAVIEREIINRASNL